MVDVGLGQAATVTGRYRSKVLKDAVRDAHPVMELLEREKGILRIDGGRTIVDEALSGQNATVDWVGEAGQVSVQDYRVADAAESNWVYQLGAISMTHAEQYKNSGGSDTKYINLLGSKFDALEASMMNEFHEGLVSAGTGSGGLQLDGLAALISTTPTTGTVGGIDRSSANAAWFRNQKFDTANDWSDGAVDAGNVKRFFDKLINLTMRNSKPQLSCFLSGQTHFEALTQACQAIQQIVNESSTAKVGFDKLVYRGLPVYYGNGVNYSGATAATVTRTYGLNLKKGGFNLVFHEKAEFDMLEPVNSQDQAAFTRLMFTMAGTTIGGFAKLNIVGFD